MADKRMFSKTIVDSDAFLEMPLSAQALYFHLSMRADDDGFLNNAKRIQKMVNASEDDLKILVLKRFIIAFPEGIIVIKHWRMNNYLRSDRYKPTVYQDEMAMLKIKDNGSYSLNNLGIPTDNQLATQKSIDKDRIEENSKEKGEKQLLTYPNESGDVHPKKFNMTSAIKERCYDNQLEKVLLEWCKYKTEKKQSYKETGFKKLLAEVEKNVNIYGLDKVINLINLCMANNWQGIIFDKLKEKEQQPNASSGYDWSKFKEGDKNE